MIDMEAYECEYEADKDKNVGDCDYVETAAVPQWDSNHIGGAAVPPTNETLERRLRMANLGLCNRMPFAPRSTDPLSTLDPSVLLLVDSLAIAAFARRWVRCESGRPSSVDQMMTGPFEHCKPPWIQSNIRPATYRQFFHDQVNHFIKPYRPISTLKAVGLICSNVAKTEHTDVYLVRLRHAITPTVRMFGYSGVCKELCLNEFTLCTMFKCNSSIVIFTRAKCFVPVAPLKLIALARGAIVV
jgi:hypothetical protein